jgi:glc operon protein GlcG
MDFHYYEPSKGHGLKHNPFNAIIARAAEAERKWLKENGPNPLDTVPEKMAADIPYRPPITLEAARAVVAAAEAGAKKRDWKMNIAVHDSGGNSVTFDRMDGAMLFSITVAEHKARAAVQLRRGDQASREFRAKWWPRSHRAHSGRHYSHSGRHFPDTEWALVGGIGVSGGAPSQDKIVAKAGAAVIGTKEIFVAQKAPLPTIPKSRTRRDPGGRNIVVIRREIATPAGAGRGRWLYVPL